MSIRKKLFVGIWDGMSIRKKLFGIWEWVSLVWCCGGGLAASLLAIAVFNWRAGLVTFAVWIISLIVAVIWMATSK